MIGRPYDLRGKRVWVPGHRGMVGSALLRRLRTEDCEVLAAGRRRLDLLDAEATDRWVERERPDVIFMAAARVGGILANDNSPVEFLRDNLTIELNVTRAAYRHGIEKMLFLGSSCIYPRDARQPIVEEDLLTGPLEPTNQWYALAKISGVRLCQAYRRQYGCDFISAMPANLYGPGDNFDPLTGHAVAALMGKAHAAKRAKRSRMEVWGSGRPMRELLYVDDCADALVHLIKYYSGDLQINVGTGVDISIRDIAVAIAQAVGFTGGFEFDAGKPDGTLRKRLDVGKLAALGWRSRTSLEDGLERTYDWFLKNVAVEAAPSHA